jgi:hypothetical protein
VIRRSAERLEPPTSLRTRRRARQLAPLDLGDVHRELGGLARDLRCRTARKVVVTCVVAGRRADQLLRSPMKRPNRAEMTSWLLPLERHAADPADEIDRDDVAVRSTAGGSRGELRRRSAFRSLDLVVAHEHDGATPGRPSSPGSSIGGRISTNALYWNSRSARGGDASTAGCATGSTPAFASAAPSVSFTSRRSISSPIDAPYIRSSTRADPPGRNFDARSSRCRDRRARTRAARASGTVTSIWRRVGPLLVRPPDPSRRVT